MKSQRCVWLLVGLLLVHLIGGCAQVKQKISANDFVKANYDYVLRIRWQDLPGAAKHYIPEHRAGLIKVFRDAKELRITDFDLVSADTDLEAGLAPATYRMEYFMLPSVKLQTFEWEQEWQYIEGVWKVITPMPALPSDS